MPRDNKRITQRQIAELAGVSQSTVSLVLNGTSEVLERIPEETQQRIRDIIRETTYVPDAAARRLVGAKNSIVGVFTYEPAFPSESLDFYTPLLTGIESKAEELGCDLLMFTSAPVVDGRRRLFHENNRLRLSDGCLLLGRRMDNDDLTKLVSMGFPFVAVGRRDVDGVPYVAADYASGVGQLVREAHSLGHRRFAYLHLQGDAESSIDRFRGFSEEIERLGADAETFEVDGGDLDSTCGRLLQTRPDVVFVEYTAHATVLHQKAREAGWAVPGDLSMVVLAEALRGQDAQTSIDFTRMATPRNELGAEAMALLGRILAAEDELADSELRITFPCQVVDGATLGAKGGEA